MYSRYFKYGVFGFHRTSDISGAVFRSFLGLVFLSIMISTADHSYTYGIIFVISAIPAAVSVIIAQFFVNETKSHIC
jgi:hypothetical protein